MNKSQVRALKHMGFECIRDEDHHIESVRTLHNIIPQSAPHAPNKNEAKLLRRLMSETGLNETQLRAHKTYRRQLSMAQKAQGNGENRLSLARKSLIRYHATNLGLPHYDSRVIQACVEKLKTMRGYRGISSELIIESFAV